MQDERLRLGGGEAKRLLDEDMPVGSQHRPGVLGVQPYRRGEVDRVGGALLQRGVEIGEDLRRAALLGDRSCAFLANVTDADDLRLEFTI